MASKIEWYPGARAKLNRDIQASVNATANAIANDLKTSGTMPYAVDDRGAEPGALQASVTSVPASGKSRMAHVTTTAPYARKLYYAPYAHPDFQFQHGVNTKAQGFWYGQYMKKGSKRNFAKEVFKRAMKARRG